MIKFTHPKPYLCLFSFYLLLLFFASQAIFAQSPSEEDPEPCSAIHYIQADDWLSKIAEKHLGSSLSYPAIVVATNAQHQIDDSFAQITNPDQVEVGWKLCVPASEQAAVALETPSNIIPVEGTLPFTLPQVYTLDNFVQEFQFSPEVNPEWIYSAPPIVTKYEILPEHQTAYDIYGYRANYFWNEFLNKNYYYARGLFKHVPPQIKVYRAAWETSFPRYRYPPNVTLPTGLTTNQFGWRGPEISLNKPPNTIRIACIGASTTVGGHWQPYGYPEYLQHWLNLWSEAQGYNIQFEVINAGREGLNAIDIASVARHEVLPLEVDYVIYYEGANQFNVKTMINYAPDVIFGQPPPGAVPNFSNIESTDKTLLDELAEYSALADRARSAVEQLTLTGGEPLKPEQTFVLPEGVDELKPKRELLNDVLELNRILNDLDNIKADLDAEGITMFLGTFQWFAYEGMILDPGRHRNLYGYLNRVYWPISYANIRRMSDFQNRVLTIWATQNRVNIIDVAGLMPRQPDLYDDAIHNTILGTRIRAWINFQNILPQIRRDIEGETLPRPDQTALDVHPYIDGNYYLKSLTND